MSDRPLIPRRLLFGDPTRMAPRISPDGLHWSWIAPRDGVLNIWVAPVDDLAAAAPMTRSARPLFECRWTPDSRLLLYGDDLAGEENRRLWAVGLDGAAPRLLTPERGTSAKLLRVSRSRPGTIVVGLNERDPTWHDAWAIDLADGARRLVFENRDGYGGYTFDDGLDLRLLSRQDAERGGFAVFKVEGGAIAPAFTIPQEDEFATGVLHFERDGAHYLLKSSIGRDTGALFRVDAATGERELLAEDLRSDVVGLLGHPATARPVAVRFHHLRGEWRPLDTAAAEGLAALRAAFGPDRDFNIYSQTADGTPLGRHGLWPDGSRQLPPARPTDRRRHAPVRLPSRAEKFSAGPDAADGDPLARRARSRQLSHAAGGGRRRPPARAAADGAGRSRRSLGSGRLWVQHVPSMDGGTAAMRCCR